MAWRGLTNLGLRKVEPADRVDGAALDAGANFDRRRVARTGVPAATAPISTADARKISLGQSKSIQGRLALRTGGQADLAVLGGSHGPSQSTVIEVPVPHSACAVSPDGKRFLLGNTNGSLGVLDLDTAKVVAVLDGQIKSMFTLAFSPNGKLVMAASVNAGNSNWPGPLVGLWEAETGKAIRAFDEAEGWGGPAAFTPDSQCAVVGKWEATQQTGYLVQWDIQQGREVGRVESGALLSRGWDSRIVVGPDSNNILGGTRADKRFGLWSLATRQQVWSVEVEVDTGPVSVLALSPDAQLALSVTGGEGGHWFSHSNLCLWDGRTGGRLQFFSGKEQQP